MHSMQWITPFRSLLLAGIFATAPVYAQVSLTSAVDMALHNSPKVRQAASDVQRAQAGVAESRDAYIPSISAGSSIGYSYGFPLGLPQLFNITAQSLVFNFSQRDYMRAANSNLEAANLALLDVRQQVEADVAITYIALDLDERRHAAMTEQFNAANRLVTIVQDRLAAGQDTKMELTKANLTASQIHLAQLVLEDDIATNREHLARLTGVPESTLSTVTTSIPAISAPAANGATTATLPGIRAEYATARAKQMQAFGDSRFSWRPEIGFGADYSRFPTFNNYAQYYPGFNSVNANYNSFGLAVQISIPLYNRVRSDRAHATAAEAIHSRAQAEIDRDAFLEGRAKLRRSTAEIAARVEVATLEQEYSQEQLDALQVQLQQGSPGAGPQPTPKDEQNARIAERQRYLDLLGMQFSLRQAEVNLMRQDETLEPWLKSAFTGVAATPQP